MSADPMIRVFQHDLELVTESRDAWRARAEAAEAELKHASLLAIIHEQGKEMAFDGLRLEREHASKHLQRAYDAEAELAQARELLFNFVEFYDMIEVGGPDDGQTDREFVVEMVGHRESARAFLASGES